MSTKNKKMKNIVFFIITSIVIITLLIIIITNTTFVAQPVISIGAVGGVASNNKIIILYNNHLLVCAKINNPVGYLNKGLIKNISDKETYKIDNVKYNNVLSLIKRFDNDIEKLNEFDFSGYTGVIYRIDTNKNCFISPIFNDKNVVYDLLDEFSGILKALKNKE